MRRVLKIAAAVVVFFGLISPASGQIIFEHVDNNDPTLTGFPSTAEHWFKLEPAPGVDVFAFGVINDGGIDAWAVDGDAPNNRTIQYFHFPTASTVAQGNTSGWTLRLNLRVVDVDDAVDAAVIGEYNVGSTRYIMLFGSDGDGDPIVKLVTAIGGDPFFSGPEFTLEGTGGGYHLYELVFDPAAGTADLFVDGGGEAVISDYGGSSGSGGDAYVQWGVGQSVVGGHGNYNLVQFEIAASPPGCPSDPIASIDDAISEINSLGLDFDTTGTLVETLQEAKGEFESPRAMASTMNCVPWSVSPVSSTTICTAGSAIRSSARGAMIFFTAWGAGARTFRLATRAMRTRSWAFR